MAKKSAPKPRGARHLPVRAIAVTVLTTLASAAVWSLWFMPTHSDAAQLAAQVAGVEQQIASAQDRVAALEGGQASGAEARLERARLLDAQLPSAVDKVTLAAEVPTLAASYNLTVDKMDPVPDTQEQAAGTISSLSFAMGVKGDREQVLAFIEKLTAPGEASRLMNVADVTVAVADGDATATFTLNAFYSTEPPLTPAS